MNRRPHLFQFTPGEALSSRERELLLKSAHDMRSTASSLPLQGRHLALLSPHEDANTRLLSQAGTALGAQVAWVAPQLSATSTTKEVETVAHLLSQLYDAVICHGIGPTELAQLAHSASIPVLEDLTAANHPTATLVNSLEFTAPAELKRQLVLQAVLVNVLV